ncbi:MAG: hypothetical protein NTV26_02990 [Caldiserica bacterium]|nr:hypothetical protein [Caldisericota bacterium]
MGARRHRNKHEDARPAAMPVAESPKQDAAAPGAVALDTSMDHTLDTFFDPSHIRLSSVMRRQSELATLAWHFALASLFVPVAGVVLGLLAVLFAREAQDMFDLVGGVDFDRRRAHKALLIGGTMTGVWLIGTVVLIFVLTSHGF